MIDLEALKSIQFVIGSDGKPSAVQMNIETWESLLDWMEDTEDRALVKELLPKLRRGPQPASTFNWNDVKSDW